MWEGKCLSQLIRTFLMLQENFRKSPERASEGRSGCVDNVSNMRQMHNWRNTNISGWRRGFTHVDTDEELNLERRRDSRAFGKKGLVSMCKNKKLNFYVLPPAAIHRCYSAWTLQMCSCCCERIGPKQCPPLLYLLIPNECLQLACVNISKTIFVCDAKAADKVKNTNVPPPPTVAQHRTVHRPCCLHWGCTFSEVVGGFTLDFTSRWPPPCCGWTPWQRPGGCTGRGPGGRALWGGLWARRPPLHRPGPGEATPPTSPAMSLQTEEEYSENEKQPECRFQGSSSSLPFDIRPKSSKLQKQSTVRSWGV